MTDRTLAGQVRTQTRKQLAEHGANILAADFSYKAMSTQRPPTIDPRAAARWAAHLPQTSPWLHEEVARRMEERLQWISRTPASWLHWSPLQGGRLVHEQLAQRYPQAQCFVHEASEAQAQSARAQFQQPWWKPARWLKPDTQFAQPTEPVQMLWANMALHMNADPQALIARWHAALAVDGFLMFSCLGPDTLRELRPVYAALGWPEPSHAFTDMHDWGDMLVQAGFAEPIMDMERISLTYSSADKLLDELRGLGRNLHTDRFPALRTKSWRNTLCQALEHSLRRPDGRLELSFEVVYGHAFKPSPKLTIQSETRVPLEEMRRSLRQIKP
jgi:malonyl-CoA O-methyltransferase